MRWKPRTCTATASSSIWVLYLAPFPMSHSASVHSSWTGAMVVKYADLLHTLVLITGRTVRNFYLRVDITKLCRLFFRKDIF